MITLRHDQDETVEKVYASVRDHQFTLLRAPTGFGKTIVAAKVIKDATHYNQRTLFLVHRREIARQTANTLDRFGIEYGWIMAGYPASNARVQIASAQTLARRPELAGCDMAIVDEAHLWAANTRAELLQRIKQSGACGIGLSATPERLDGRPLTLFNDLVLGPDERWLMDRGFLSEYKAFAPVQPDLSGLRVRMGDYAIDDVLSELDKPSIVGDAPKHYIRLAAGLRCLVFAASRLHGEHLRDAYEDNGIPAVYIDGETNDTDRMDRIASFAHHGGVLVNVSLCVEGFDLSAQIGRDVPIEAVSLQNPTQSLARAMQMIGRTLRPKSRPAIIMDHVNILETHGLPDDYREWSLAGYASKSTKSVAGVVVRVCHVCQGAFKPGPPECPYCDTPIRLTPREIKQKEGELAEFVRMDKRREEKQARTLSDLVSLAKERGYKKGWVAMRLQGRGQRVPWSILEEMWSAT